MTHVPAVTIFEARDGDLRFLRIIFVPDDETCLRGRDRRRARGELPVLRV